MAWHADGRGAWVTSDDGEDEMKYAMYLAATLAVCAPNTASAGAQSEAAAMQAFGLMMGAIMHNAMPPPQTVIVVPQPYPVYVQPPVCWFEQRLVPTDYGLVPQTVRVCQ